MRRIDNRRNELLSSPFDLSIPKNDIAREE